MRRLLDKQTELARAIVKARAYSAESTAPVYVTKATSHKGTVYYIERVENSIVENIRDTIIGHAIGGVWSYTENKGE